MKELRIFDNKYYRFMDSHSSRRSANASAKDLRRSGYNARVIPAKGGREYQIWGNTRFGRTVL